MFLSDFLSSIDGDSSHLHDIVPISFNSHSILMEHCNAYSNPPKDTYRVVTRSQTKVAGTQMPKVHGVDKAVDPNLNVEHRLRKQE